VPVDLTDGRGRKAEKASPAAEGKRNAVAINSLPPVNFRQSIETTEEPGENMFQPTRTDRQTNYSNFQISNGGSFRWQEDGGGFACRAGAGGQIRFAHENAGGECEDRLSKFR